MNTLTCPRCGHSHDQARTERVYRDGPSVTEVAWRDACPVEGCPCVLSTSRAALWSNAQSQARLAAAAEGVRDLMVLIPAALLYCHTGEPLDDIPGVIQQLALAISALEPGTPPDRPAAGDGGRDTPDLCVCTTDEQSAVCPACIRDRAATRGTAAAGGE